MKTILLISVFCAVQLFSSSTLAQEETDEFINFLKKFEATIIPLSTNSNIAYYKAAVSGKDEDYKLNEELRIEITKFLSNRDDYKRLEEIKKSDKVADAILSRELDLLLYAYKGNQADPSKLEEVVKIQTSIEQQYATYRATVNGKELTDNEIEEILRTSTDSKALQEAWQGSKQVGKLVESDVIKLVEKRNEIAHDIGYNNFYEMSLLLNEQDPAAIERLFDQLDKLTGTAYKKVKEEEIDPFLAARLNIPAKDLMPWHYQNRFFQEAPAVYKVDLDKYYEGKDVVKIARDFYKSIGIDVDDILANSDLFEKPGKQQHAFCTDIDRQGDVRIFLNAKNDAKWMETTLHELGHAAYSKNYAKGDLPYVLKEEAHIFVTEAIAMLFGRLGANSSFMKAMLGLPGEEANTISNDSFRMVRLQEMVFSRWSQVMYHFEKSMYENPKQDLNALWWSLVEKYQMVRKPEGRNEPDWASKIHIATVPCYYHNYLLGELLASQLNAHIVKDILKSDDYKNPDYVGKPDIGEYLVKNIFAPGKRYAWSELIRNGTGEELTPRYYVEQFLN